MAVSFRGNEIVRRNPFHAGMMMCARGLHRIYKRFVSPLFGNVCRFEPFCSDYALEALERHGLFQGSYLTLRRIVRCNPWCKGGHDPVPPA